MKDPGLSNSRLRDYLLDEAICPVARMRLFSDGVNENTRIFQPETVIGDRGCLACGNCVDACPVVQDKQRFVLIQNQRTSMALENIVGEECRRCYRCILSCPQVSKNNKTYAAGYRRGEKIVHLLTAVSIVLLAATGITTLHYGQMLPRFEEALFLFAHKVLGILLVLMPVLYLVVDKTHLFRWIRKVLIWGDKDKQWVEDLIRHIKESRRYPLPYTGEFNPGQKAWYLYISVMIPIMGLTGILMMFVLDNPAGGGYLTVKFIHLFFALITDLLLFVHIYLKYIRRWAILAGDVVRVFWTKRHLDYAQLYDKRS